MRRGIKRVTKEAMVVYGTPTEDTDPGEVLLDEIRRTAGAIQWLAGQIAKSNPQDFTRSHWLRGRVSGFIKPGELDLYAEELAGAIWVELYQVERKHLAAICRTALAAGLEERRVRMAEKLTERMGEALEGILYDLGIDPEDESVREVIYRNIMTLQGIKPVSPLDPEMAQLAIETPEDSG